MKTQEKRMEALLWAIIQRNGEVVDRLLDAEVKVPEVSGDFYITVNGVPACVADLSLTSHFPALGCQHSSLHRCIAYRKKFKGFYPGAVVSIVGGNCPLALSFVRAA